MADNKTQIDIELETREVSDGLRDVDRSVDDVVQNIRRSSSTLDDFVMGFTQGIGQQAFRAIQSLIPSFSDLKEAISRGADINDITASFENLATQAGVSADALINDFSAALGGTLPKVDAMKQANELLLGGLDPSKFELVAQAARAFADVTGGDAVQGMEALTDSLLRGNDRALKNIGIVVDNEKAYQDFAASIGTTADKLSESGKVMATQQAVLRALEQNYDKLGAVSNDAGDNIKALSAAFRDQVDRVLAAVAGNDTLNRVLEKLVKTLREVDLQPLINGLNALLVMAGEVAAKVIPTISKAAAGIKILADTVEAIGEAEREATPGLQKFLVPLTALDKVIGKQVAGNLVNILRGNFTKLGEALEKTAGVTEGAAKAFGGLSQEQLNAAISGLKVAESQEKAAEAAAKLAKEAEELKEKLNSSAGLSEYASKVDSVIDNFESGILPAKLLGEEIRKLALEFTKGGGSIEDFNRILGVKFKEAADKAKDEALDLGRALADGVASGIRGLLEGDFKGGLESIGGSLGDLLGKKLGGSIGEEIGGSFEEEIGGLLGKEFGGAIGGPIGAFLGEKLGDAIFEGIDHIFGGRDAQGKIRDSLDKLFADALKDNPALLILEGELKRITDLDFLRGTSAFEDGSFDDLFQGLSDSAKRAFEGIALGFEESGELSGQLAAILSNNVGGSLNNLQLLVEATGKSFEDLRAQVVEAFLDGEISALKAQDALNGINQIATKGIPDGIGLVAEAFNNLKNAGVKGGRALVDALQDIGFEAKELGDKTLEQVVERLKNTAGVSAEEVDRVFNALRNGGIDTLEELTSATAQQLLPVLAELEATEFPFKEAAEDAKEYLDALDRIPSKKDIELNIRVNTIADSTGKQALNAVSGSSISNAPGRASL